MITILPVAFFAKKDYDVRNTELYENMSMTMRATCHLLYAMEELKENCLYSGGNGF